MGSQTTSRERALEWMTALVDKISCLGPLDQLTMLDEGNEFGLGNAVISAF